MAGSLLAIDIGGNCLHRAIPIDANLHRGTKHELTNIGLGSISMTIIADVSA
jgi:hypothetical protein